MGGPVAYVEVRYRPTNTESPWKYRQLTPDQHAVVLEGLEPNTQYAVEARSVGPTGLTSLWVDLVQQTAGPPVPVDPSALSATPLVNGVALRWTMPVETPPSTVYEVERAPDVSGSAGTYTVVGVAGTTSYVDPVTVNGMYWYRVKARSRADEYSALYSNAVSVDIFTQAEIESSIANALTTAQNAQATADGAIESFWQASPPAIGAGAGQAKVGDIWFDTDDGNKIYRVVGSSWVSAQDDDIAQAILAATNAQATADGKVKTYFQGTAPTASAVGDLWFNTTTKKLFRWNGSTWSDNIGDVTLDQLGGNGINLLPDQYSTFEQTTLPSFVVPGGGTPVRDPNVKYVVASLTLGTSIGSIYLGGAVGNLTLTPGRKYIVSFYVRSGNSADTFRPLIEVSGGVQYFGTFQAVGVANSFQRLSYVVDCTANTQSSAWLAIVKGQTAECRIDGIMIEEAIGTLNTPSAYSRGNSANLSINALVAAQNAQATADGKIDIYRQSSPPTIGGGGAGLGDYWQDSDDGRWYYCNGSIWTESTDTRLPQLVTDLQTTNGVVSTKTRLFYQETTPTATALGDMWYQLSTGLTRYWNGTGWSLQADYAPASTDTLVLNPNFEQGSAHWGLGTGWYVETSTNAAISGTGLVRMGTAAGQGEYAVNDRAFPVTPGSQVYVSASIRNLGNGANGTMYFGLFFYDAAGNFVDAKWGNTTDNSQPNSGTTEWRVVSKRIPVVPVNAAQARVGFGTIGHTAGYWCIDNTRAAYVDEAARALLPGTNLVANGNFTSNSSDWPVGIYVPKLGQVVADGWVVSQFSNTSGSYTNSLNVGLETASYNSSLRQLFVGDVGGTLANGDAQVLIRNISLVPANEGEKYVIDYQYRIDQGNARPSGLAVNSYMGLWCYTKDNPNTPFAFVGLVETNRIGVTSGQTTATIPANTAFIRPIVGLIYTNTSGGNLSVPWAVAHARFQRFECRRVNSLDGQEVADGVNYGRTSQTDLVSNRVGLRISGSGHRIGDQRNLPQSNTTSYGSVRNTAALSATSAGAVTVNAHTVRYGGVNVSYSAVTNAVTGLTQGSTYIIYCYDDAYQGGTRTWYAGTNPDAVMQLGDGVVVAGQITIPTSGSSSGGDGGGGTDPGGWCVDAEMLLPDGRKAADIAAGDWITCWDGNAESPGTVQLLVESNEIVDNQPSTMIITESGVDVSASNCTPMTLRDGRIICIPEMLGEDALVLAETDNPRWERVKQVVALGLRTVCKIRVHQQCYFAGSSSKATIATHNPIYKP